MKKSIREAEIPAEMRKFSSQQESPQNNIKVIERWNTK
jgi:hypothetical protein